MNDFLNSNPLVFLCGFSFIFSGIPAITGYLLGKYGLPIEIRRKHRHDE